MTLPTDRSHSCPRRMKEIGPWSREVLQDVWREDETCSFCGSLNPDEFMRRLEAGVALLTPTDKNYKVYIEVRGASREKFYFQHLSGSQMRHFIRLYNDHKLTFNYPGNFYRWPFFMRPAAPTETVCYERRTTE